MNSVYLFILRVILYINIDRYVILEGKIIIILVNFVNLLINYGIIFVRKVCM